MFGNSCFRDMQNDPFFSHHNSMMGDMDRMMSDFHSNFGMPAIGGPMGQSQQQQQSTQSMMPFGGSMFGNMFGSIDSMFPQMSNDPNNQCFSSSSSKVISFSNDGTGQPKYYEATSQTRQGPGGVRQTRNSERNSETGLDRMQIGHHLYDRGHLVERSRNRRSGNREEKQEFMNMDEDEKDAFHREWQEKAHLTGRTALTEDRSHHRRREPRALNSADYHRQKLERDRTRHGHAEEPVPRSYPERPVGRRTDRSGDRHVRMSDRFDEI